MERESVPRELPGPIDPQAHDMICGAAAIPQVQSGACFTLFELPLQCSREVTTGAAPRSGKTVTYLRLVIA